MSEFIMPGEFEKHRGCVIIWPVRPGSWPNGAIEAQDTFLDVIITIAISEKVWIVANPGYKEKVKSKFNNKINNIKATFNKCDVNTGVNISKIENEINNYVNCISAKDLMLIKNIGDCEKLADIVKNVEIIEVQTDDSWARDVGPTCVKSLEDSDNKIYGVDWKFNAWGGDYDGLYAHYENDDKAAEALCSLLDLERIDAHPFVLEGGSIHSDGEGTIIVTESCLLSKGRNPDLSKEEIEEKLSKYLGAKKIIWLPYGIYNDETNEHVDNVCAFARPSEVILAWTDNVNDPQYEMSLADLKVLENERDAKGRKFIVHKLPIPDNPVCIKKEELSGYEFEEGEDEREEGERLAASYVNFYISNEGIILPQFGNGNEKSDERAVRILTDIFPDRKICPVYARPIIVGGGNIHCITQQIL